MMTNRLISLAIVLFMPRMATTTAQDSQSQAQARRDAQQRKNQQDAYAASRAAQQNAAVRAAQQAAASRRAAEAQQRADAAMRMFQPMPPLNRPEPTANYGNNTAIRPAMPGRNRSDSRLSQNQNAPKRTEMPSLPKITATITRYKIGSISSRRDPKQSDKQLSIALNMNRNRISKAQESFNDGAGNRSTSGKLGRSRPNGFQLETKERNKGNRYSHEAMKVNLSTPQARIEAIENMFVRTSGSTGKSQFENRIDQMKPTNALRPDAPHKLVFDIRGQRISNADLRSFKNRVLVESKKTGITVDVEFVSRYSETIKKE